MIGLIVLLFSAPILLGVLVANAIVLLFWVLKVALEIIVFFIDAAADVVRFAQGLPTGGGRPRRYRPRQPHPSQIDPKRYEWGRDVPAQRKPWE